MGDLARFNKLWAALVGAVAQAVTLGLVPDPTAQWLAVVVSFVTAAGVFAVENTPPHA